MALCTVLRSIIILEIMVLPLFLVTILKEISFHTLYGHLSLNSIKNFQEGENVRKGDVIGEFGIPMENGQWPPHLHFQVIIDMEVPISER